MAETYNFQSFSSTEYFLRQAIFQIQCFSPRRLLLKFLVNLPCFIQINTSQNRTNQKSHNVLVYCKGFCVFVLNTVIKIIFALKEKQD